MTLTMTSEKKKVDLDDVLMKFSMFGRYHGLSMVLIFLANVTNSLYCSNYVFAAEEVGYRCKDTINVCANSTEEECVARTVGSYALCATLGNSTGPCTEWVYDNPHSFVAELACHDWKRTLVGTVHSFGYMVGLLFIGPISDRLGRKMAIVITGVCGGLLGLARSFTTIYWLYIALEFLESAIGDICSPVYMLSIEMVAKQKRVTFMTLCCFGFATGGILLSMTAWAVPYWRSFLRVIYTPALLFFFYMYLLDESPRWLLTKGQKDKALAIIERAADKSNIKLDKNILYQISCHENKNVNFVDLLKSTFASKAIFKRFVICVIWWTTSTFVNYGMTINSVSLQGNKYVNFALLAIIDIPGNVLIAYTLIHFKRRLPLICTFFAGAILCLSQPFVPNNLPWLATMVYMAGKLMSSFYFNITYIYTSELFPTYTRNSMHALCSSLGRIGSIIAPQTPLLMRYWTGLPSIVFGSVALFAGLATFFVPDTADNSLPDTVKQAEALGTKPTSKSITKEPVGIVSVINKEKSECSRF